MCLLLALRRDGGLIVAANRDEHLERPWEPPRLLTTDPPVFAGRDVLAGGSWLAVNLEARLVVAVTNARLGARPRERSRGHLVLEAASQRSLGEAAALVGELDLDRYGAFNLLLADPDAVWLATNWPVAELRQAAGDLVALGNDALASPGPRVAAARERAAGFAGLDDEELLARLVEVLSDHEGEDPVCRHSEHYGTVSSTLLALGWDGLRTYRFAPGPPCRTAFSAVMPELPPHH